MKKRIALIFLIAILLVALAGCQETDGKSRSIEEIQEKYNDLLQKYTSLQEDYDELASDYDSLLSDYATHMADDKISDIIYISHISKFVIIKFRLNYIFVEFPLKSH